MVKDNDIKYTPVGKRILIELPDPTRKTKHGILLPEVSKKKEKENKATIVMFGLGYSEEKIAETGLHLADEILFNEVSGELVKQGKRRLKIIELGDIYAVIK